MAILLYVDDEQAIGRAVARWFGRRGHIVHLAAGIADAQRVLAEHEPDVLFLDVWLGHESGFELMSWIEDARPRLAGRVVFVTGELPGELTGGPRGDRLWRTLGRPVLRKPFDFAELEAFVEDPGGDGRPAPPADAEPRSGT